MRSRTRSLPWKSNSDGMADVPVTAGCAGPLMVTVPSAATCTWPGKPGIFTTTLVLGAAIAESYSSVGGHGTPDKLIYLAAAALTGLARLAAGGIITARS